LSGLFTWTRRRSGLLLELGATLQVVLELSGAVMVLPDSHTMTAVGERVPELLMEILAGIV